MKGTKMKLIQICLTGQFNPNLSYQDNMLSKYYARMGLTVITIATPFSLNNKGIETYEQPCCLQISENEKLIRLPLKKPRILNKKLRRYKGLKTILENERPDIIFVHGGQFLDIGKVVQYAKKHKNIFIYVDNHADFSNSATNFLSLNILHKVIWKRCIKKIIPFTIRFYGVLPARVDFLQNVYGVPRDKVELLAMGADDEKVNQINNKNLRDSLRKQFKINKSDFLVVTGGKIDLAKQQVFLLIDAINQSNIERLKLIIFGSIAPELEKMLYERISDKVQYIGWVKSDETYKIFTMADLVCFPGRHSVFWEQVVGIGIPMLVKYWEGTTHVDLGGNVEFLYKDDLEEIKGKLYCIVEDNERYRKMKEQAQSEHKKQFMYSYIASKSIRDVF